MTSKKEILDYITKLNPLECALCELYQEGVKIYNINQKCIDPILMDKYKKYMEDAINNNHRDVEVLDKIVGIETYISEKEVNYSKKINTHMTHQQYFINNKNIYINKHHRFTPASYHDHEFIEICYSLTGKVKQTFLCQGIEEEICMNPGSLVIIPPGMKHKLEIYNNATLVNIIVNKNTFERTFMGDFPKENLLYEFFCNIIFSEEKTAYITFHTENQEILQDKLLDLIVAYLDQAPYSDKMCEHCLSIFFLQILRESNKISLSSEMGHDGEKMAEILLFIQKNFAHISLEQVAKEFHYSTSYTNRFFKKHTGTTVLKYIQKHRLEYAAELLRNTKLSIEDIAYQSGYEDCSYFIELFKKEKMVTPLKYRETIS